MKAKPLLVTVFADASRKVETSTYGFWFKSQSASGRGGGQLPHSKHTEELELRALLKGIRAALDMHPNTVLSWCLQCDNINSLAALHWAGARFAKTSPLKSAARRPRRPEEKELVQEIMRACIGPVYLKHVKGHTNGYDARSYVNRLTDSIARKAHD